MRGEHLKALASTFTSKGSSPHARGTLEAVSGEGEYRGIIPACAGNTNEAWRQWSGVRDHPRMRGEHRTARRRLAVLRGSSPHARGTPAPSYSAAIQVWIIPACAGNTSWDEKDWRTCWDHPRMRGEHFVCVCGGVVVWGSSPHARGTLRILHPRISGMGIIPACAGNTPIILLALSITWDHPRMRGEHPDGTRLRRM